MKILVQIVDKASVSVDNNLINEIDKGYLIFVGIEKADTDDMVIKMATKVSNMRIFEDENGKTNLSIHDVNGSILSISQFTLCANMETRRPSFTNAKEPIEAKRMYELFNDSLRNLNIETKEGVFGAEMIVSLINHGPFTIYMDDKML